ncbi:DUF3737 family protein [Succinivibrio dextrinosolvens]|jgi:hypothetical protein|uniref:DUF3737 family protein n=1 Tax=Succinivibrio dextrinosolvens TaxID=83771 RepID=UPI00241C556A|nr:DUF3737 family protein [Succinivibrio dextrinosolvens]MBE6422025.1 DUF3737 family protein [Succinivibrio dextrinosolvens]
MSIIENREFEGERPLFYQKDLSLSKIKVLNGESAIKECTNVTCTDSSFNGKYPFWHADIAQIEKCVFETGARAAIWYSKNLTMKDCQVIAPKMFRRCSGLKLLNVDFTDAQETLWDCTDIRVNNIKAVHADYIFMNSSDIEVENFELHGNYSFQNCSNVKIKNSNLETKDAFWEAKNVTVENCTISGEFLGWHSENLTLINCKIKGTQPLCYAKNLKIINCTFDEDCDLAFEYSSVDAEIKGHVTSIKNPLTGRIRVDSVGEIISDANAKAPNDCVIEVVNE